VCGVVSSLYLCIPILLCSFYPADVRKNSSFDTNFSWYVWDIDYCKLRLCRVQYSLSSVKNQAFGKDLLCRVLHSAKNCTRQRVLCRVPGTRQKRALGKWLLCRVLDSRQNLYTWHRLPAERIKMPKRGGELG